MRLTVYLAGQIHDDWRDRLRQQAESRGIAVEFVGPQDEHDLSDGIGLLNWLFQGGPGHVLGVDCVQIVDCEDACN